MRAIDAAGNPDPTPASHAWTVDTPDATGTIAFVDEFGDIFTMNPDGSALTNVTDSPTAEQNPAFSPDGDRIAFDSSLGRLRYGIFCERDIHVMNQDGTGESNLTQTPDIIESDPAWSPDGAKIAFVVGTVQRENATIWVMDADGSDRTRFRRHPVSDLAIRPGLVTERRQDRVPVSRPHLGDERRRQRADADHRRAIRLRTRLVS